MMPENHGYIKITSVPPGEAPLYIRQEWVGLCLPLALPGLRRSRIFGVLSRPKTKLGLYIARKMGKLETKAGYAVLTVTAIEMLGMKSPFAAAWWRKTLPQAPSSLDLLMFAPKCCELTKFDANSWPPPPEI